MQVSPRVTLTKPVWAGDHVAGPDHAPVTVLEYGDFQCPSCKAAEPAVRQLRELHRDRLRFAWRHFPLEHAHPHALLAAEAAEAAAGQGRFWEMHDLLLEHSPALARRDLDRYAAQLGLDHARVTAELDDHIYLQRVREHQASGTASHLRATPSFFVNGVLVDVSGGMRDLHTAVEHALHAHR